MGRNKGMELRLDLVINRREGYADLIPRASLEIPITSDSCYTEQDIKEMAAMFVTASRVSEEIHAEFYHQMRENLPPN